MLSTMFFAFFFLASETAKAQQDIVREVEICPSESTVPAE